MLIYNYYGFKNSTVNHIPKAVSWKFHMVAISNSKSSSSLVPMRNLEDNLKNNEKKKFYFWEIAKGFLFSIYSLFECNMRFQLLHTDVNKIMKFNPL